MKRLAFTEDEREWLKSILSERLAIFQLTSFPTKKMIHNTESAIAKLFGDSRVHFKEWEVIMSTSCINEKLSNYYRYVNVKDAFGLMSSSETERAVLNYIDLGRSILLKLGDRRRKTPSLYDYQTSYRERLLTLRKLSQSDIIFISQKNDNQIYKIGFVYQNREASVYEMRNKVEINDLQFYRLKKDAIEYGKTHFSSVTNRSAALLVLSSCTETHYPDNQLAFFRHLLKD